MKISKRRHDAGFTEHLCEYKPGSKECTNITHWDTEDYHVPDALVFEILRHMEHVPEFTVQGLADTPWSVESADMFHLLRPGMALEIIQKLTAQGLRKGNIGIVGSDRAAVKTYRWEGRKGGV